MSLVTTIFISTVLAAGHLHPEAWYQQQWCDRFHGQTEVTLEDKTRADCITTNYAVEFDFAPKWAECLGQALHYADLTEKHAACVLIIERPQDWKHYRKLRLTARKHGAKAWYVIPKRKVILEK